MNGTPVTDFAILAWGYFLPYYLIPGLIWALATIATELMLRPKGSNQKISVLIKAIYHTWWFWPLVMIAVFRVYLRGETILTALDRLNQTVAQRDRDIKARKIPYQRKWIKCINSSGITFYYYTSDFYAGDAVPAERRITHLIKKARGHRVVLYRNGRTQDEMVLPYKFFFGPLEAKLQAEKDVDWLDLVIPGKEADHSAAYHQMFMEQQQKSQDQE